jgi:transcriptional regulator with XRE-family HTH domain
MNELFGARLRRERERRQIPLASIAADTKINASLFEALERGDVSRWPSGVFRRAFVRAYAQAIGLDPDQVLQEFLETFPDPVDPQMRRPRAASTAQTPGSALRLTLAETHEPFWERFDVKKIRQRLAAVVWDATALGVLGLALFLLFGTFWMPFAVASIVYCLGGILVLGTTPGVSLLRPRAGRRAASLPATRPMDLGIANRELGIGSEGLRARG